jgi:endogenous inhibitor of DNA gyrase (YacG/DUF329 family)
MLCVMAFTPRCPTCSASVPWENNPSRPFCSERCRLVDLGGWLAERYRVPGDAAEDEDDGQTGGSGGADDDS